MKKSTTINKHRTLPQTQDFTELRRLGLQHIESLASDIWTDYNVHDPGITILEVLCYALTDLAYRTGFKIEDLLTRKPVNGPTEQIKDFFTAAEVLTCNPVTIPDFRKVLIDQEGVQNGWLRNIYRTEPLDARDPAFYYKCENDGKAYQIKIRENGEDGDFQKKILNGLYNVSLQLDEDDRFGDLNTNVLDWDITRGGVKLAPAKIVFKLPEVEYPSWDYPIARILQENDDPLLLPDYLDINDLNKCELTGYRNVNGNISFDLIFTFSGAETISVKGFRLLIGSAFSAAVHESDIEETFEFDGDPADSFALFFLTRLQKILGVIRRAYCALHRHRSLCEDYVKFSLVRTQEIGICAYIDVKPGADLETVLARIYFEIDRFLAPPVRFYSLKEMLEKGKTAEEIFDGHIMEHGFIDMKELADSDLKSQIHVSDLYRIIMAMEEVVSVRDLLVTNYLDGRAQTEGEKWCLHLGGPYHLNLSTAKSTVVFYKDLLPYRAKKDQVEALILNLKAADHRPKFVEVEKDFPVPAGDYKPLEQYYSIQNDFPLVYGIGRDGLPATASAERKARAKQLKAFLMFFDQLLANYLAQLEDAKNQLSINPGLDIKQTSAVQPLYKRSDEPDREDFPDVAKLFKDFVDSLPDGTDPDDTNSFQGDWDTFTDNPDNRYMENLRSIVETKDQFLDRRNRFLDHLIARFSEAFTDYAVLMYDLDGEKKAAAELIPDKEDFLARYPEISSQRGKAFQYKCYKKPDSKTGWQESNVAGLKKRMCKLLGIDAESRRPLGFTWEQIREDFPVTGPDEDGKYRFKLKMGKKYVLWSKDTYSTKAKAEAAVWSVIENGADLDNYAIQRKKRAEVRLEIDKKLVARGNTFGSEAKALGEIRTIAGFIKKKYHKEGMHIVEHILLRPVKDQVIGTGDIEAGYFPECEPDKECRCPVPDYYSFRITIVLPYWPQRFRNMNFREYVEKTIRMETPAHIVPKICWVSPGDMKKFEDVYLAWLGETCKMEPIRYDLSAKIKDLIKTLNNLTSVYPRVKLHDCKSAVGDAAVVLDKASLGTFEEDE